MILAGDVGGTKTHLALFDDVSHAAGERPRPVRDAIFDSRATGGLEAMAREFLAANGVAGEAVTAACFGVAGPVAGDRAHLPNLPWNVDGGRLGRQLGIARVAVINDLVATAGGIPLLGAGDLATLQGGRADPAGARAVIAAGTGCGMAILPAPGDGSVVVASEGGHADFAPRTEREIALLRFLARRFGHVSVERVVSGPGLRAIYEHLREAGVRQEPELERIVQEAEDPSAALSQAALAGRSERAAEALDLFTAAYGAAAGNLALVALATGGLYLGGGIAPKILPRLEDGTFLAAFRDKGRYAGLMERIPVHVILEPATALLGAARWAGTVVTARER